MKIENCKSPVIGEYYEVKCVLAYRRYGTFWMPVFSDSHKDGIYGLDIEHFHVDWRFVRKEVIEIDKKIMGENDFYGRQNKDKAENYSAILKREIIGEPEYMRWKYLRHFSLPEDMLFHKLRDKMKNCKMKEMICPHHGANLISCLAINGVVTCPQHGLKWNVETGELIL